jgi:hypothetical protein
MAVKGSDQAYNRAAADEPIFTLRAQDTLAPVLVRAWVALAEAAGSPKDKVAEALDCAEQMEEWQHRNGKKVPD